MLFDCRKSECSGFILCWGRELELIFVIYALDCKPLLLARLLVGVLPVVVHTEGRTGSLNAVAHAFDRALGSEPRESRAKIDLSVEVEGLGRRR